MRKHKRFNPFTFTSLLIIVFGVLAYVVLT